MTAQQTRPRDEAFQMDERRCQGAKSTITQGGNMRASKENRRKLLLAGLGGLAAQFGALGAAAQDPAKVTPRAYRVAFENDKVRVLDFVGRPGMGICGEGMHSHPAHLTIVMSDWQGSVSEERRVGKECRSR